MEILIISKSRGRAGGVRLSGFVLTLGAIALIGAGACAVYAGYVRGSDDMAELILNNPERSASLWQREIVVQRQLMARIRSDLDAEQWQTMRRTGTSHLLAISGLHISLCAAGAFTLARWLSAALGSRRQTYPAHLAGFWAAMLRALGYTALAGFAIPSQRAVLMDCCGGFAGPLCLP